MQDRETMETVIIILISVLIALTIGLIVIVLLRSKDQKGNIGKQDLQVTTDQLDKTIKQSNQAVNDVLMMMQRQVGQTQTDAMQQQTLLRQELSKQLETLTSTNEKKLELVRQTTMQKA